MVVRLLLVVVLAAQVAHAKERLVRHIGIDDKLLPENVTAIAQDPQGFLWFGTAGGLIRYDGTRLVPWAPDVIRGSVARIAVRDGELIAAVWSGGAFRVTPHGTTALVGPDGQPLTGANDVWFDATGRLWVSTQRGVLRLDGERWSMPLANTGAARATRVRAGPRGLFAITRAALWSIDAADRVTHLSDLPEVEPLNNTAEYLLPMPDGSVFVSTWLGHVNHYRDGRLVQRFQGNGVPRMMARRGDVVWVVHDHALAAIHPDGRHEVLAAEEAIAHRGVAVFVDREDSLWVGNSRGVFQFPEPATAAWNARDGLPNQGALRFARTREGLWVTHWGHKLGRIDPRRRAETVADMVLGAACVDERDVLWGTRSELGAKTKPIVSRRDGAWKLHLDIGAGATCKAARAGGVWFANDKVIWRTDGDEPRELATHPLGLPPIMLETRDTLFFAGGGKLCAAAVATLASWSCHPIAPGPVTALAGAPSGAVWIAGSRTGVSRWTPARGFEPIAAAARLPSPTVHVLEPARDGGLWLGGGGFLLRVIEDGEGWTVLEQLGPDNGMPGFNPLGMLEDEAGTLWASIGAGVLELPRIARRRVPPIVTPTLIDIAFDGRPEDRALAAGDNAVQLQLASLSYRDPSAIQFRVRLGETWSAPSRQSAIQLVDLPAGEYGLEVSVSRDGIAWISATTDIAFTVERPWYLRPWAWVMFAALVALAIVLVRRLRIALARRLERQRLAIAMDLHDDVGSGLGGIGLMAGLTADGALDDHTRRETAAKIARTARTLGESLSNIVTSLRNDTGSLAALAAELVERASMLFPDHRPRLDIDMPAAWPDVALDRRVERNVKLIVAEALHNAAKHAQAGVVVLAVRVSGSELAFHVEDDGRGTPTTARKHGLGLTSMRRRASRIGARFAIVSPAAGDRGTRVVVGVDLAKVAA